MERKEIFILYLIGFILVCLILSTLDEIIFSIQNLEITLEFPKASDTLIEGEAKPVH